MEQVLTHRMTAINFIIMGMSEVLD